MNELEVVVGGDRKSESGVHDRGPPAGPLLLKIKSPEFLAYFPIFSQKSSSSLSATTSILTPEGHQKVSVHGMAHNELSILRSRMTLLIVDAALFRPLVCVLGPWH